MLPLEKKLLLTLFLPNNRFFVQNQLVSDILYVDQRAIVRRACFWGFAVPESVVPDFCCPGCEFPWSGLYTSFGYIVTVCRGCLGGPLDPGPGIGLLVLSIWYSEVGSYF